MNNTLSDTVQQFLRRYDVIQSALERFHRELEYLFRQIGEEAKRWGFVPLFFRPTGALGQNFAQFARPNWQNDLGKGIHFEFFVDNDTLKQGDLVVGLDVGEQISEKEAKRDTLVRILKPFEPTLLTRFGFQLRRDNFWKILYATIPLLEVSVETLRARCQILPDLAAFVDEGLFLVAKHPIWRTDFSSDRQDIWTNWFGQEGGQHFVTGEGRLGSCALKIDGTQPNARPKLQERGCYSVPVHPTHAIVNGKEHYLCVVVKSRVDGTLRLRGEGHKGISSEGHPSELPLAFDWAWNLEPSDHWQCLTWRGVVPPVAEIGYDFSSQGTWIVMIVDTVDREFLIDMIEIGQCSK